LIYYRLDPFSDYLDFLIDYRASGRFGLPCENFSVVAAEFGVLAKHDAVCDLRNTLFVHVQIKKS